MVGHSIDHYAFRESVIGIIYFVYRDIFYGFPILGARSASWPVSISYQWDYPETHGGHPYLCLIAVNDDRNVGAFFGHTETCDKVFDKILNLIEVSFPGAFNASWAINDK